MRAVNRPVSWWGWHWTPPVPMSIVEIISAGSMSSRLAALFWLGMERGASIIVAAEPPSAGKTTTLTALLAFTPPETVAYFTQGIGETFAVPPLADSYPTYILINELSDHLPVYTWGPYAQRAFELLAEGYSLASTMHADRVEEVLGQLQGDLGIPAAHVSRLTFIVPLRVGYRGRPIRRLQEVAFLAPDTASAYRVHRLARWQADEDTFSLFEDRAAREAFCRWAGMDDVEINAELDRRQSFLEGLLAQGVTSIPRVAEAIEDYYRQHR